jgi:hypothetical protein
LRQHVVAMILPLFCDRWPHTCCFDMALVTTE